MFVDTASTYILPTEMYTRYGIAPSIHNRTETFVEDNAKHHRSREQSLRLLIVVLSRPI